MKKLTLLLFLLLSTISYSQSIFGKWESKDLITNKVDSVIEVYKKNGKAYAKIVAITDKSKKEALCTLCKDENKNKPVLGMEILTGLKKDGDEWSDGTILDPRNGKIYKCYIKLVKPNKLKLRGYIGISLFGKTEYMERAE
ncbi:MAG: hypothetical protein ACI9SI_000220 [Polaribacter sp.]|jgi:uncharacterized protein (DUF2147 family)